MSPGAEIVGGAFLVDAVTGQPILDENGEYIDVDPYTGEIIDKEDDAQSEDEE